jgi:hypothetical protein
VAMHLAFDARNAPWSAFLAKSSSSPLWAKIHRRFKVTTSPQRARWLTAQNLLILILNTICFLLLLRCRPIIQPHPKTCNFRHLHPISAQLNLWRRIQPLLKFRLMYYDIVKVSEAHSHPHAIWDPTKAETSPRAPSLQRKRKSQREATSPPTFTSFCSAPTPTSHASTPTMPPLARLPKHPAPHTRRQPRRKSPPPPPPPLTGPPPPPQATRRPPCSWVSGTEHVTPAAAAAAAAGTGRCRRWPGYSTPLGAASAAAAAAAAGTPVGVVEEYDRTAGGVH